MNTFMEIFAQLTAVEFGFMRYALLVGFFASPVVGVIGTMVVTRRISSLAGASAHAALGGVGLALFLQRVCLWSFFTPVLGAVIGAVTAALLVGVVSMCAREREDTVIGVVWALGMAIGLLFLDRTPGYVDWQGYLFGNILLLSGREVWMTIALDLLVLVPLFFFYRQLLAFSFDGSFAMLRGIPVRCIWLILLGLTALTIVLLMKIVGIILVIALLTLPAAVAGCFTRHLWSMMLLATVLTVIFVITGLFLSYFFRLPSGPAIVLLAGIVYVFALSLRAIRNRG